MNDDDDDDLAYSYVKLIVKLVRVSVCSNSERFYYSNFETQIFLRMITDVDDCHYKMKIMFMIITSNNNDGKYNNILSLR